MFFDSREGGAPIFLLYSMEMDDALLASIRHAECPNLQSSDPSKLSVRGNQDHSDFPAAATERDVVTSGLYGNVVSLD
jgi:hypothetical protein